MPPAKRVLLACHKFRGYPVRGSWSREVSLRKGIWAIALLAFAWLAWPYYAAFELVQAVQSGDVVALEHRVD